jgi:hypothetical protein
VGRTYVQCSIHVIFTHNILKRFLYSQYDTSDTLGAGCMARVQSQEG